jgi:5-methylcytosine-specific restriction endonuclease McrA
MNSADRKVILPFLHDVAGLRAVSAGLPGSVPCVTIARKAEELIERFKKKRRPMPLRKREKLADRAAKNEETTAIREEVFRRANGRCEFCGVNQPAEMHHLENGIGRRRQLQAVSNCVAICMLCHREYHRSPEDFRENVARWATKHGYPMPSKFRSAA